ncbi:MAG: PLP-dependent aminotransferase family protein [Planctomycetota bacterium]
MRLDLDRDSATPLHVQIAHKLRELILTGAIPPGGRLLPSRKLAETLQVNRSTVIQAYQALWAEGLIAGQVGRGTVVRSSGARTPVAAPSWEMRFATGEEAHDLETRELVRLLGRSDVISLAAGLPAPDLFPMEELEQVVREVLARDGRAFLHWCAAEGYAPLRKILAERFTGVSPAEVMVLSGSSQGLHLLSRALIQPGDFVVVESPTYLGALQVFRGAGARLVGIPVDEHGLDIAMLERVLARMQAKFVYTIPTYQNPTGATLSLERRRALLELAYRHGVPVIEDDPYSLLGYEGDSLPSLKELDTQGYVLYLSTFTKTLFPGLRVGWLVAPKRVIERLTPSKYLSDLFTSSLAQAAVHEFCRRGLLEQHLNRVREEYRKRRDVMERALRQYCPKIQFTTPRGGYFIWGRLPHGIVARELLREALEKKVSFINGEIFSADGRGQEHIRLTFASSPPAQIEEGIQRLAAALRPFTRQRLTRAVQDVTEPVRPIV